MAQDLAIFNYEGSQVRTIETDEGILFVANDVCGILGVDATQVRRLDDDEKGLYIIQTLGGHQSVTVINESGLYSLTLTSRKEAAKKFKKWITSEVLPSIRKTGTYSMNPQELMARGLIEAQKVLDQQTALIAEIQPKAIALDRISSAEGSLCLRDAAKSLQPKPSKLNAFLQADRWIYRRPGKGSFIAYQDKIQQGLLIHKITPIPRDDDTEKISEQVRITAKGMTKLAGMLGA